MRTRLGRSLTYKLVAAFLGVGLLVIALVALASAGVASLEFNRLVNAEATNSYVAYVTDYYLTHGSLDGIDQAMRSRMDQAQAGAEGPRLFPTALTDANGVVVVGGEGYRPGETVSTAALASATPIKVNGQEIAAVLPRQLAAPRNRAQEQFLQTTGIALGTAALGGALVAVLLGLVLARTITRPVTQLTSAAQRLANGDLSQQVEVKSRDEVGELAAAFNQMSAGLARADEDRRQMTADIAHELRNPLTVIGGYIEAMRSGDLPATPARLDAVYREIKHLEHLVEDLRTLSLAETGALALNKQPTAPADLLARVRERYEQQAQQKGITLEVEAEPGLPELQLDQARMMQVFGNLVGNALRYTPQGGRVRLSARTVENRVRFSVVDTGEGIKKEDLERVFERLYRADQSRSAGNGESGLGLAIARAFVRAHGGRIWAESEPGHGADFLLELES